ncbi:HpcH/HpaI aldolase/citrate lyase family protein [Amycolatopsis nigrescens]|uniref:HpcH/HpaI aldolase/citrate lyase family protein n=1 Tax=Amycolatopsis nigrescens TaxID=381445 RepID=UPI0003771F3F|nr:CoA ester lyase [Amycolatopsis nigrescens]
MPLTYLYVPGDRPDRFAKALVSGADVVIVDLEDAVAAEHKEQARATVAEWLPDAPPGAVEVRVNALGTPWAEADLAALEDQPSLRAVRLPKVEAAADVVTALDRLAATGTKLQCLIETARGVEAAYQIATASARVAGIGLGEADLRGDLGLSDDAGLSYARSRIVVAARAAGLEPPVMSVYPHVADLAGLAESCRAGRRLGFVGRGAIHPRQLPVIRSAFRPSTAEVAGARELLSAFDQGVAAGRGVIVLADGRMVDAAMVSRARQIIELAALAAT